MSNVDPSPPPAAAEKSSLTKKLPTFRVGFSKQMDALRAYAMVSENGAKPVHYSAVGDIIKVHEANVSSMNPFFLENGFIEKHGNGYMPTAAVLEFNRASQWNPETAAQTLAPIVANTWFGIALKQRLQFRPMSDEEAIQVLAALCNAGPSVKPQLRMLLDYCEAAGIIQRAGGQITAAEPITNIKPTPATDMAAPTTTPVPRAPVVTSTVGAPNVINMQIAIQVDLAEMSGWPPERISAFFGGIAQVLAAKNQDG